MGPTSRAEVMQPVLDVFAQTDPWTEAEFLARPADRRVERLDGALLASPSVRLRHQRLLSRLAMVLDTAVPPSLEVLKAINVRVGPAKMPIPNLAVISTPGLDLAALATAARPCS